jgi:hypothetical protein
VSGIVEEAVAQRVAEDESPGRLRAVAAAVVVGVGAAVLTYRLLRSESGSAPDSEPE